MPFQPGGQAAAPSGPQPSPEGQGGGESPAKDLVLGIAQGLSELGQILPPEHKDELAAIIQAFKALIQGLGAKSGAGANPSVPVEAGASDVRQAL
jgi:hypothetical protein